MIDHERAARAALLSLPKLGPSRFQALLDGHGDAASALAAIRAGRPAAGRGEVRDAWRAAARRIDLESVLAAHRQAGVEVLLPTDDRWPQALVDDPEPPPALFVAGDVDLLDLPSAVAIVGTRRCSALGARVAAELGRDLAGAGVAVVSGLALGIDAHAHRGALAAGGPAVAVVGTGLDVIYPARNADLWHDVRQSGVLVSEYPLGTRGERWRFPARNRIIAALAQVVVVVESGATGGSLSTVDHALDRQRVVGAVPGAVGSPSTAGSNQLLADGALVVCAAADVLAAVGLAAPDTRSPSPAAVPVPADLPPDAVRVLDALADVPMPADVLAEVTGLALGSVFTALVQLEAAGLARHDGTGHRRVVR